MKRIYPNKVKRIDATTVAVETDEGTFLFSRGWSDIWTGSLDAAWNLAEGETLEETACIDHYYNVLRPDLKAKASA